MNPTQLTLDETEEQNNESVFLQKLNRILTDDTDVTVNNLPDNGPEQKNNLGGADGKNIYINFKKIRRDSKTDEEEITILKAINLHELSHVEWTDITVQDVLSRQHPALRTNTALEISETAIKDAINILEDARIENLRACQYVNGGKYFLYTVLKYILGEYYKARIAKAPNESLNTMRARAAMHNAFILTYGRKFINRQIIYEIENEIINGGHETSNNLSITKKLIDQYLLAPTLTERLETAIKFAKHTRKNSQNNSPANYTQSYSSSNNNKIPHTQNPTTKQEIQELTKQIQEAINHQKKGKNNTKKNNQTTTTQSMDSIDKLIKTAASSMKITTERLKNDIKKTLEELKGKATSAGITNDNITPQPYNPTNNDQILSTRLLQKIRKIRNDLTSRYIHNKPAGRIDIRKIMLTQGKSTKVFRKYQQSALGRSKMAVSLLIDASGSMRGTRYKEAIASAWSMEKALSTSNDHTQVIDYNTNHRILKAFKSRKANWNGAPNGGTDPETALKLALKHHQALKNSENINTHLIFILTDGEFSTQSKSDEIIQKMNKRGFKTILIKIQNPQGLNHQAQFVRDIKESKELENVIETIIQKVQTEIIRENRT